MSVVHGASEYLGTGPFRTEATSLIVITAPVTWVPRAWLGLHATEQSASLLSPVFGVDGGGRIEASTRCNREFSTCCTVLVQRMLLSH
jgi:hypothetical protein